MDIGYINARIRAMRSYLLRREDYEELLRRDFNSFSLHLRNLPSYSDDLREIQVYNGQTREAIDEALKNNLVRNFRKIINFSADRPKQLILLILHRWDIYNLKVVLRGIFNNLPRESILGAILRLGEWDETLLGKLSEQDSIDGIIDILSSNGSLWSTSISSFFQRFKEDVPLREVENTLDVFYFNYCIDNLDETKTDDAQVLELIRYEVDFRNILYVLNSILHLPSESEDGFTGVNHADIGKDTLVDESYIIQGGRIPVSLILNAFEARNIEEALNILSDSYYKNILAEAVVLFNSGTVVSLEIFFKKQLFLTGINLYRKSPLNIGISIGYLLMKEAEIINLRTLAKGLYYGIDPDILYEELILSAV